MTDAKNGATAGTNCWHQYTAHSEPRPQTIQWFSKDSWKPPLSFENDSRVMLVTAMERSTKESCGWPLPGPHITHISPILSAASMPPPLPPGPGYCSPGEGQGSVPGFTQFPSAMRMFILVSRISYTNRPGITKFMAFLNIFRIHEECSVSDEIHALSRCLLSGSDLASWRTSGSQEGDCLWRLALLIAGLLLNRLLATSVENYCS